MLKPLEELPAPLIEQSRNTNCLMKEGSNCWRIVNADRGAFIISGREYFRAFRSAMLQARKKVYILAWDLKRKILLERDGRDDGFPHQMGPFIIALLKARPGLHIYLSVWDFAVIYALEREWDSFANLLGERHPRLHLVKDSQLPLTASHHQKVVVIDDALAFCGGLDFSAWRWDSTKQRAKDSRRADPSGKPYGPYHDTEMVLTGEAARALGDLCAYRWKRATGKKLPRCRGRLKSTPWPEGVAVDFRNQPVAIARTYAAYEPEPAVREIEQFHLDIIQSAKRYLYFENQYFSSRRITDALIARLQESEGPEIIIVLTQDTGGWLEENTMGLLRNRLFEKLSCADKHNRLRLFYPRAVDDGETAQVYVHAKVIIADDRLIKIGSSNLSNRSMRVDSEVDLILEHNEPASVVRHFRNRLLGIHYTMDSGEIATHLKKYPGLIPALDALVSEDCHSLLPFEFHCDSDLEQMLTETQLLDPDEPIDPAGFIQRTVPRNERPRILRRTTIITVLIILGIVLALLIKWGWGNVIDRETLETQLQRIQSSAWTPLTLVLVFFITGMTGIPVNPILVASALIFGPWLSLGCGLAGSHLSALAGFGLGHRFGKPLVEKFASRRIERMNHLLGKRGVFSVLLIRLVPLAPFVLVNLLAGASRLRFGVFNLGTGLGILIGMSAVVLLTDRLDAAIRQPGWINILGFTAILAVVVGGLFLLRRSLKTGSRPSANKGTDGS